MLNEITVNTARTQSIEHVVSELSKRESITMAEDFENDPNNKFLKGSTAFEKEFEKILRISDAVSLYNT